MLPSVLIEDKLTAVSACREVTKPSDSGNLIEFIRFSQSFGPFDTPARLLHLRMQTYSK